MVNNSVQPHRRRSNRLVDELTGAIADAAVRGVDLDGAISSVDLDAQLERIDVNRLLDRVDVNHLLDRVDVNRLLDRVDVDRLLDRADVNRLVARAGVEDIVRRSTGQFAGGVIDVIRRQVVAVDLIVMRVLYRLTGRSIDGLPAGPDGLLAATRDPVLRADEVGQASEVVGRYAGLLPRLLAVATDLTLSSSTLTVLLAIGTWLLSTVFGQQVSQLPLPPVLVVVSLLLWPVLWWTTSLSAAGRTPGMAVVGLRLLRADGSPLPFTRVIMWTLVLPVSTVHGAGFLLALVGSRRQTLHDRVAGAAVVYDWGRRGSAAETPLSRWIHDHAGPSETSSADRP